LFTFNIAQKNKKNDSLRLELSVKHVITALTQIKFNGVKFFIPRLTQLFYKKKNIYIFFFSLAQNKEAVA
jgi:hypothetical protein